MNFEFLKIATFNDGIFCWNLYFTGGETSVSLK